MKITMKESIWMLRLRMIKDFAAAIFWVCLVVWLLCYGKTAIDRFSPAFPQTVVIKNLVIEVEAGNIRFRNFRAAYERPSFWFEGAEVQEKEESDETD